MTKQQLRASYVYISARIDFLSFMMRQNPSLSNDDRIFEDMLHRVINLKSEKRRIHILLNSFK